MWTFVLWWLWNVQTASDGIMWAFVLWWLWIVQCVIILCEHLYCGDFALYRQCVMVWWYYVNIRTVVALNYSWYLVMYVMFMPSVAYHLIFCNGLYVHIIKYWVSCNNLDPQREPSTFLTKGNSCTAGKRISHTTFLAANWLKHYVLTWEARYCN